MYRSIVSVCAVCLSGLTVAAAELLVVEPQLQRVHEIITLRGSGFGRRQDGRAVLFTDGSTTIRSGKAYLWRDEMIQVRVPVGNTITGSITPIPKTPLLVAVETEDGRTNFVGFQVITSAMHELRFRQLTSILSDRDTSTVIGDPATNFGRSKDAEIGDVNGDGFPDLFDNNSNNERNGSHSVLRLNNADKTFASVDFAPLTDGETGTFAATVPAGGDFMEDHASYDADFIDIDLDGFPDLLQTAADNYREEDFRIRLFMNNHEGVPGRFIEDSAARLPAGAVPDGGWCPDDFDHADVDNDGDIDFLVTLRTAPDFCDAATSETRIFLNDGGGRFGTPIVISAPSDISTHDALFIDANNDGFEDIVTAHEWHNPSRTPATESQLFLHNRDSGSPGFSLSTESFPLGASTGAAADFNGDGLPDLVLARVDAQVFINNPASVGTFAATPLPGIELDGASLGAPYYDLEVGDIDLDGWPDIVGARLSRRAGADAIRNVWIWINNRDGTFRTVPGFDTVLPDNGPYQRLSADLLDFDLDGDLDLYLAGADVQDVGVRPPTGPLPIGRVPNQFYENLVVGLNILSPDRREKAYGGSSTVGSRILVRLLGGTAGIDLSPGNVALEIGGEPVAAVIGESPVDGEYWMLIETAPRPNGCYDLDAALVSDPEIRDREPESVCFRDQLIFDRVVSIDRTNSMMVDSATDERTGEKMIAARAAANFFVDLSNDEDYIGVVSFKRDRDDGDDVVTLDELARTDFALAQAMPDPMTDNRAAAIAEIRSIGPDGEHFPQETSIGAGLTQAWDMLPDSPREREIVLLSDGRENFAPFWEIAGESPLKPQLGDPSAGVRVHTIAIGSDANVEVLLDIATTTGGRFWSLLEGRGSYGLMSRLAAVYKEIDELQRDEQRFFYREGIPPGVRPLPTTLTHVPAAIPTAYIPVPDGFLVATFGFHWNRDDAVTVMLADPSGTVVTAAPGRLVTSDARHQAFRISDPEPGLWRYQLRVQDSEPDLEFFAVASGIGELVLRAGPVVPERLSPGRYAIPVRVVLGDFRPIRAALVSGTVTRPDRVKVPVTWHDDGAHRDGRPGDGVYGAELLENLPGAYLVSLKAAGTSSRGEPFARYTSFSFVLPSADPQRPGNNEPDPQRSPWWVKCLPCALLAAVLAAFIVLLLLWLRGRTNALN